MKILTLRDRSYLKHLKHSHQLRALMKRREADTLRRQLASKRVKGVTK